MSVLLFGVSHRSAPVSVLEQLSTDESDQAKIVDQVLQSPLVTEAMVLATCNRVEVYAVVDAFHGGLSAIGQVLAEHSGMSMGDLTKYAYVRYSEAAVEHLFAVASGLDSAVIGEQQVLGQVRRAYASAEANQTVGRVLHDLAQRALSVGQAGAPETAIDAAGASVVSVALDIAGARLDTGWRADRRRGRRRLDGRAVGGASGAGRVQPHPRRQPFAAARAAAGGQHPRAGRRRGGAGRSISWPPRWPDADVVISCTGAVRPVVSLADASCAGHLAARRERQPLVLCDLGMPRDVDPCRRRAAGRLGGRHGVGAAGTVGRAAATDAEAARQIVAAEVAEYLSVQRMGRSRPPSPPAPAGRRRRRGRVAAAGEPVAGLDDGQRVEVARTVRRVVDKLLHAPTVRVKQLASAPAATPTPRRCVNCSNSTRRPSTPSPRANCRWRQRNSIPAGATAPSNRLD